jgi:hypothetical protein
VVGNRLEFRLNELFDPHFELKFLFSFQHFTKPWQGNRKSCKMDLVKILQEKGTPAEGNGNFQFDAKFTDPITNKKYIEEITISFNVNGYPVSLVRPGKRYDYATVTDFDILFFRSISGGKQV